MKVLRLVPRNITKGVVLFGCGNFARASHLNILGSDEFRKFFNLIAVVEREKRTNETFKFLQEFGFNLPHEAVIPAESDWHQKLRLLQKKGEKVSCSVISSTPETHLPYIEWSLRNNLPTFVDKPLTFSPFASSSVNSARSIYLDYLKLVKLAKDKGVALFMLGTQKRYQSVFKMLGEKIRLVFEKTGYPVTQVDCLTSDGYWLLPEEYGRIDFHSYANGGGKLIHTGYHFLDIVPWLMRFASKDGTSQIHHGWVTAQVFRPSDSVNLMPSEKLRKIFYVNLERNEPIDEKYGDINANILIKLCDETGHLIASLSFNFLHEGFSLRRSVQTGESITGRTKIDSLKIFQGPVFFAEYRKFSRIFADSSKDNPELTLVFNKALTGQDNLVIEFPNSRDGINGFCEDDQLPLRNFFNAVLKPKEVPIISPVTDHGIGIKFLSAAYESVASSFRTKDNRPVPVKVNFEAREWVEPPI